MNQKLSQLTKNLSIKEAIDEVYDHLKNSNLFFGHGTDNAWDEAVALVLQGLHLPFDIADQELAKKLTLAQIDRINELLHARVVDKVPLPYLVNTAYFAGLPFLC